MLDEKQKLKKAMCGDEEKKDNFQSRLFEKVKYDLLSESS
jgi:hypothetical protein